MTIKSSVELVREGRTIAEVDVHLIETDSEWSPYTSLDDAEKLEAVRIALQRGDLKGAGQLARVYEMTPVRAAE